MSPGEQHSGNPLDYALYAVFVHVGASIRMGHYVAYIKDPRGGWFKVDDHKASPVFLSEVLQFQAYMLCYIHKVQTDVKIDHVKQQTEQVFDGMDEDGTPDAVGIPSLPESKTCTEPEQIASHLAPTVEELTPSHAVALMLPAGSCWMGPVLEEPPTGVKNSSAGLKEFWSEGPKARTLFHCFTQ